MRTIYKYPLPQMPGSNKIKINEDFVVLKLDYDPHGTPCIWAIVDTDTPMTTIHFEFIGTGWPLSKEINYQYIGTLQDGIYMWHCMRYFDER